MPGHEIYCSATGIYKTNQVNYQLAYWTNEVIYTNSISSNGAYSVILGRCYI